MKSGFWAATVFLCLLFPASVAHSAAVFAPNPSNPESSSRLGDVSEGILRQRVVELNPAALSTQLSSESIELHLFANVCLKAEQKSRQGDSSGFLLWTGDIVAPQSGEVVLVLRNGAFFASVYLQSSIIQIRPVKLQTGSYSNVYVIRELAGSREIREVKSPLCPECGIESGLTPAGKKMIELVNLERMADGIPALEYSGQLTRAASRHGMDMALHDSCSHELSDGEKFFQNVFGTGYPVTDVAENIAVGLASPEETFESMYSSPEHRPNMMSPRFTQIGVCEAFKKTSSYHYFWAMELGAAPPKCNQTLRFNLFRPHT